MTVYRLLALRYLFQRWDRAALIILSISLGVATLVSARILNRCVELAALDTTTPGGSAELYVANGEAGVLRGVADELRAAQVPGDAYYERQKSLDSALQKALEELADAERAYRRGAD